ncbi:putative coiled-coil domain-containing protein [Apostichopus japonicus]|uniref:Dynein regulatory complex protein 12 n=1 Tax=Stichopus japonicus TaxID=307972 RepID=A0A2G8LH57_STIJA|nr:putative coiled-coil domain-containing protein [Apostichopus japonicus]
MPLRLRNDIGPNHYTTDAELTIDDKYKKTLHEIEALKDHLASRKEIARRAQSHSDEWKRKMEVAHDQLTNHKDDQRAVTTDMTRQYKHMQTEMNSEIHHLTAALDKTKLKLEQTERQLDETTREKERVTTEKDQLINELQDKIKNMEFSYESMMQEALDNMVIKLDTAQKRWQEQATNIHFENKQKLMEFGLNPLDI